MVPEKQSPGKKFPGTVVAWKKVSGKKSPERSSKKWSLEKCSPKKWSPEKWPLKEWSPENYLKKWFSVKRMLGNLKDFFIFIDWFHYTHRKMFDIHLTIIHAPNCKTLKESRKVCCLVLGFHRLITNPQTTGA